MFTPSKNLKIDRFTVGQEKSPVIVIDDFCDNPEQLIVYAEQSHFISIGPTYPGVRAPAPEAYGSFVLNTFASVICDSFQGCAPWGFDLCAFSMVTTPPHLLSPLQSQPHFDGLEQNRIAFLHYLCDPSHGGTSFYRQKATGFERIFEERLPLYLHHQEFVSENSGYCMDSTQHVELIGKVDAKFNRAVFYPGSLLHSGDILSPQLLSENVRTGRLTINGFVVLEPA